MNPQEEPSIQEPVNVVQKAPRVRQKVPIGTVNIIKANIIRTRIHTTRLVSFNIREIVSN
jgi:hypothetical protein